MFNTGPRRETAGGFLLEQVRHQVTSRVARSHGRGEVVLPHRGVFAAKIRLVRAVLGWSQGELGRRAGLTQRAIHKLEKAETEPRRATVRALEQIWRQQNIEFEDLVGGFRAKVRLSAFPPAPARKSRTT